jgi:DNA uptake protein ComE-like DNA-binding protein
MPEDAGKKRYIKSFLQQVKSGAGFIEDIRIERVIREPGSDGEGSTSRSLSGRQIANITQLLEDDLRHTFDDGFFTFRFVAALVGSGKTSLLTYLNELTKTKSTFLNHSIVVQFQLSDIPFSPDFRTNFYCHILADTFCELLHNHNLLNSVRVIAEKILSDYLETNEVSQLKTTKAAMPFRSKFKKYITKNVGGFEEFFFDVIYEVSQVDPRFSFVYLGDELDALADFPKEIQETRLAVKQLIRRAFQVFSSKIRLLMYLVGTSDNVGSFIAEDSAFQSLIGDSIINLNKGYSNEFEIIREKIDNRIKGAYSGYKNFNQAWQEIKNISISSTNTLREFCRNYGNAILEIHEKYFQEAPEQVFEGDARNLVEAECKQQWASFLSRTAYTLSNVSTTTVIAGHAFDCYVELLHNGTTVARAFGEAKNYEMLSSHFNTFTQWLNDVKFNPCNSDGTPTDLAFMIAPSCPPLLQRKLDLRNIHFIQSDKIVSTVVTTTNSGPIIDLKPIIEPVVNNTKAPNWIFSNSKKNPTNINTATKHELTVAFKGTGIKQATIDKLLKLREKQLYKTLDTMASDLKFTPSVKTKLQEKLNAQEICF